MSREREIRIVHGSPWYVLHYDGGAVVYSRMPGIEGASIDIHEDCASWPCEWCDGTGEDDGEPCELCDATGRREGKPCEFLGGKPCRMDGTSLAPVLTEPDEIWALCEVWVPEGHGPMGGPRT